MSLPFSFFSNLLFVFFFCRPSEDDVAVLRTELVHAQKLMDEISQLKDVEINEHINSIRQLNMEREKYSAVQFSSCRHLILFQSSDKNVYWKIYRSNLWTVVELQKSTFIVNSIYVSCFEFTFVSGRF